MRVETALFRPEDLKPFQSQRIGSFGFRDPSEHRETKPERVPDAGMWWNRRDDGGITGWPVVLLTLRKRVRKQAGKGQDEHENAPPGHEFDVGLEGEMRARDRGHGVNAPNAFAKIAETFADLSVEAAKHPPQAERPGGQAEVVGASCGSQGSLCLGNGVVRILVPDQKRHAQAKP